MRRGKCPKPNPCRELVVLTLMLLGLMPGTGCVGGQGGDEGLIDVPVGEPVDDPPTPLGPGIEPPARTGPGNEPSPAPAGSDRRRDGDRVDDEGELPEGMGGETPLGGSGLPSWACRAVVWPGPDSDQMWHVCQGPSEQGPWTCTCGAQAAVTRDTQSCSAALLDACGVEPDPQNGPRDHCTTDGDYSGACWRVQAGGWDCRCGDPSQASPLARQDVAECDDALFRTCAVPCEEPLGTCNPVSDGALGQYTCDCTFYGAVGRPVTAGTCHDAVSRACNPEQPASCNSYSGYCDPAGGGLSCSCLDGTSATLSPEEADGLGCQDALVGVCGAGEPPADRVCEGVGESQSGRCVDLGGPSAMRVHQCRCESQPAAIGVTASGPSAPSFAELDATRSAVSCQQALALHCPGAVQATLETKASACQVHGACNEEVEVSACTERVSAACSVCTLAAAGAAGDDSCGAIDACASQCRDLVPPPDTPAACQALVDSRGGPYTQGAKCLCDRCLDSFGACLVDPGCTEIVECAGQTGCEGVGCYAEGVCRSVIDRWGVSSDSTRMAQTVGACDAARTCIGQ